MRSSASGKASEIRVHTDRTQRLPEQFQGKGVPLGTVVEVMCIYNLCTDASMNRWRELANKDDLTKDFICYGYAISRKTMNRALEYLDNYFEEITAPIWMAVRTMYPNIRTH